jgi:uncharacterized protein YndB with AHSA1/START domain
MDGPSIEITTYLVSTPDEVWDALTNPDITERYWGNTRLESDWKVGSKVLYVMNGKITDEQTLLVVDRPRLLSYTFKPLMEGFRDEPPSRATFEIASSGQVVRLKITHDRFPPASRVHAACSVGWPMILSGLKTLLETGRPLPEFEFS